MNDEMQRDFDTEVLVARGSKSPIQAHQEDLWHLAQAALRLKCRLVALPDALGAGYSLWVYDVGSIPRSLPDGWGHIDQLGNFVVTERPAPITSSGGVPRSEVESVAATAVALDKIIWAALYVIMGVAAVIIALS